MAVSQTNQQKKVNSSVPVHNFVYTNSSGQRISVSTIQSQSDYIASHGGSQSSSGPIYSGPNQNASYYNPSTGSSTPPTNSSSGSSSQSQAVNTLMGNSTPQQQVAQNLGIQEKQVATLNLTPMQAIKQEAKTGNVYTPSFNNAFQQQEWQNQKQQIVNGLNNTSTSQVLAQKYDQKNKLTQSLMNDYQTQGKNISNQQNALTNEAKTLDLTSQDAVDTYNSKINELNDRINSYTNQGNKLQANIDSLNKFGQMTNLISLNESSNELPITTNLTSNKLPNTKNLTRFDTTSQAPIILESKTLDLIQLGTDVENVAESNLIDVGLSLKKNLYDMPSSIGIASKKEALAMLSPEEQKNPLLTQGLANLATIPLIGKNVAVGVGTGLVFSTTHPNEVVTSLVEQGLTHPAGFATDIGINVLAFKGMEEIGAGLLRGAKEIPIPKISIGKTTTYTYEGGGTEFTYLGKNIGSKVENGKILVTSKTTPEMLVHEEIHRGLKLPEYSQEDFLNIRNPQALIDNKSLLGSETGTAKDLISSQTGKYLNVYQKGEILPNFAAAHPSELINPTTQTGEFLKSVLNNERKVFGEITVTPKNAFSASLTSSGKTLGSALIGKESIVNEEVVGGSLMREVSVERESKNLVNVKGLIKTEFKEVGTGLLNKGKIYEEISTVEPIKIKAITSIEPLPEVVLKPKIVSSSIKMAEQNIGKVTVSAPEQFERLSEIVQPNIVSVEGKSVIGFPNTSRLFGESRVGLVNETFVSEVKSGLVIEKGVVKGIGNPKDILYNVEVSKEVLEMEKEMGVVRELNMRKPNFVSNIYEGELGKMNLEKIISKESKGVKFPTRVLTKIQTFDKTSSEDYIISNAGKTVSSSVGYGEKGLVDVKLSGSYYYGLKKLVAPKVSVAPEVKLPSVPGVEDIGPVKPKSLMSKAAVDYFKNEFGKENASGSGTKTLTIEKLVTIEKPIAVVVPKNVVAQTSAITKTIARVAKPNSIEQFARFGQSKSMFKNPYAQESEAIYSLEMEYVPGIKVGEIPKEQYSFKSISKVSQAQSLQRLQSPQIQSLNTQQVQLTKSLTKLQDSSLQKTISGTRQVQLNQVLTEQQTQVLNQTQLQRQMQKQLQLQKQVQLQKMMTKTALRTVSITSVRTPLPKIPEIPLRFARPNNSNLPKLSFGSSKLKKGFNVFTRRKGKQVLLGSNLPVGRAFRLGESKVLDTLARSFKVTPSGFNTIGKDIPVALNSRVFRPPKSGRRVAREGFTFVQRSKFSLSSLGEKREIKSAKLKKLFASLVD